MKQGAPNERRASFVYQPNRMQQKTTILTISLLLLLLTSCSQQEKRNVQITNVDVKQDLSADSFITDYSYIQLDSVTSPMLSDVRDMRFHSDNIYILDSAGRIFTFSNTGHFINVLDSMGTRKEQYITADAFDITNAGIFVLCRPQQQIQQYSFQGKHVHTFKLNDYYLDFRILPDSTIILASGNTNRRMNNFITYDIASQNVIRETDPFERTESLISATYRPFIGKDGGKLYVTDPFCTKVKVLDKGKTYTLKSYTFNTPEQLPENVKEYTFDELAQMFKHKPVVRNISLYYRTTESEYIGYELFGECGLSYIITRCNKKGKSQSFTIMNNPEPKFPYLSAPLCVQEGKLASVLPAYAILQIEQAYGLKKFTSKGIHSTDNPVIFLHKLR